MNLDLDEFLRTEPVIAIVGATNDSSKYSNIIMRDLLAKGFKVLPINPRAKEVLGVPAYPDLKTALKENPGLVVYVVPPKITLESLKEALKLNLKKVWVQPGAGDEAIREFLDENGFEYLLNACVMMETR